MEAFVQQVSEKAIGQIVGYEVTSQEVYEKLYQRPTWPAGASGVTIGIGYDLGYATADEFAAAWQGKIPDDDVKFLSTVCGVRGDGARIRLSGMRSVLIPWGAAYGVFKERTIVSELAKLVKALPGCEKLSPDSLGALLSLSYNRGPGGFSMNDDRHKEMAEIKIAVGDGLLDTVPMLIRRMQRLWQDAKGDPLPGMAGLTARRENEAVLFEQGLVAPAATPAATPS
jgi:GH24 family phage-related lysozyme (muramidase)